MDYVSTTSISAANLVWTGILEFMNKLEYICTVQFEHLPISGRSKGQELARLCNRSNLTRARIVVFTLFQSGEVREKEKKRMA